MINNFCNKKKIVAGAFKHLSYAKGGVQIPLFYIRYIVFLKELPCFKNSTQNYVKVKNVPSGLSFFAAP